MSDPSPQSLVPNPELDSLVRRVDEDRWLASRFASPSVRARLIAIYALNYEIARTANVVSEEGIGHIRLAWWREAIGEIHDAQPARAHPALVAYAAAHCETPFSRELMLGIVDAHGVDFESAPFRTGAQLRDYLYATAGAVMRLAVIASEAGSLTTPMAETLLTAGAQAWGCIGLIKARPSWTARGRCFLPHDVESVEDFTIDAELDYLMARQRAAEAWRVSATAFPALGYLALAPSHFRALRSERELSMLARQLRLIAAAATGRL